MDKEPRHDFRYNSLPYWQPWLPSISECVHQKVETQTHMHVCGRRDNALFIGSIRCYFVAIHMTAIISSNIPKYVLKKERTERKTKQNTQRHCLHFYLCSVILCRTGFRNNQINDLKSFMADCFVYIGVYFVRNIIP